jgi:GTP-binding protein Era
MLITHQHPLNRSLTVSLLGAPNVGKSTLINCLTQQDLCIVTPVPQTTRNKLRCVYHEDLIELIFTDTPGLHLSYQELNLRFNEQALLSLKQGHDLNLLCVDLSRPVLEQVQSFKSFIQREYEKCTLSETWLVLTKVDKVKSNIKDQNIYSDIFAMAKNILPELTQYFIVSHDSQDYKLLKDALLKKAPNSPHLFPDGDLSDKNLRFFASEYIREACFLHLKEELPHECAVIIDDYQDRSSQKDFTEQLFFEAQEKKKSIEEPLKQAKKIVAKISATIIVNRPSQRSIVIGAGGKMIKTIGIHARSRIEKLLGGQIILALHVSVKPKWFKNNWLLEELGLPRSQFSPRVWREPVENKSSSR